MRLLYLAFAIIILTCIAFAACSATTSAVVTGTAPAWNATGPGSCEASADTLRDLKEVVLEGRVNGTPTWNVLRRSPSAPGAAFSFFVAGLPEVLYDFRVYGVDSTGNVGCADSIIGHNLIRVPSKAALTGVSQP